MLLISRKMRTSSAAANKINEKRKVSPPAERASLGVVASIGNKITTTVTEIATANKKAIPLEEVCIYLLGHEFVANAFDGGDIIDSDFLPDFTNMHINRPRQNIHISSPNIL